MTNLQLIHNLKVLREDAHLTHEHLAAYLNISRQAYSNYEQGTRAPDLDTLIRLSQFYKLTLDQLVHANISEVIRDVKGPYGQGLHIKNNSILYLTDSEINLIMSYRQLSDNDREVFEGFLEARSKR